MLSPCSVLASCFRVETIFASIVALALSFTISASADELAALSDEFDDPLTVSEWKRVFEVEGWGADQLEKFDLGRTQPGWLAMIPHASTWYQDYRGELAFKAIEGDFVVTSRVHASRRGGEGAPRTAFSLAGLMVRAPRDVTPRTWRPGGENYVFLSIGAARDAGRFAFEVKTTEASVSTLRVEPASTGEAVLQIARIGETLILLMRPGGGEWTVHQRYRREDLPRELQVGVTVYTDYDTASRMTPEEHNRTVIRGGSPDLVAGFDYVRFRRPTVPPDLVDRDFSDPRAVGDDRLLRFLGESAAASLAADP